ncbi:MAG: hypothetical protein WCD57_24645 [Acidobacteriaceae bacterium]
MPTRIMVFLHQAMRWVRYAYFMRFSLGLWLFALILCCLNTSSAGMLTTGIMTPETIQQYACVGFFLVSAGFVALITARVVLINGPERWDKAYDEFDDGRPLPLIILLVNDRGEREWAALLISQLPNTFVYLYLTWNAIASGVPLGTAFFGLFIGSTLALVLWWVANAWYYLTYEAVKASETVEFKKNAARTLLFPRRLFGLAKPGDPFDREEKTLEAASTWIKATPLSRWLRRLAGLLNTPGYVGPEGHIYEGHVFSAFGALIFLGIYLLLWPMAAPVPVFRWSLFALGSLAFVAGVALWFLWKDKSAARVKALRNWKIGLTTAVVAFVASIALLYFLTNAERFPMLATILIVAMALCWPLCGISFFFDRYRLPVITVVLVITIAPRLMHWDYGQEEHYLSITDAEPGPRCVPTPKDILLDRLTASADQRDDSEHDRPLIMVTATGGGLHASAWTAAVLARLEATFDRVSPGSFHRSLLLASTVSGGSVGLFSYLREIQPGWVPDYTRMQITAQCSSLEAVGWGFAYYDLPKTFVPLLPYFIPPSTGDGDLDQSPLFKDRSWSLRKALARNTYNEFCMDTWRRDRGETVPGGWRGLLASRLKHQSDAEEQEKRLTLRSLLPSKHNLFPAFTMNTTSYEDGLRFLLANYRIPDAETSEDWPDTRPNYKARSFLATYGTGKREAGAFTPDLPLATAAQLSAAFPYISSAARVPLPVDNQVNAPHFVDGGYYDNDGTASVVEFLRYALARAPTAGTDVCEAWSQEEEAKASSRKLRILLIEIRNSGDDTGGEFDRWPNNTSAKTPANLLTQLFAPPLGLWQAGHESVTGRNRLALAQLEHALADRLDVHRVVFADSHAIPGVLTDPLSWSLTPAQRREVQHSASSDPEILRRYNEAVAWFTKRRAEWDKDADSKWHE